PAVRSRVITAEKRRIVLRAAEVLRAVAVRQAVIELRHAVTAIERLPLHLDTGGGRADGSRSGRDARARVARPREAAVVADDRDLVALAVVLGMKDDRVLIHVRAVGRA